MTETKIIRRDVPADLIEATPGGNAIGHWLLASPLLLFLGWLWVDFIRLLSPLPQAGLNLGLGILLYLGLIVLPLGYLAHRLVLSAPRLFHNAGWDVQPLAPVSAAEQYLVRYRYQTRHWAENNWHRAWIRAAQGWVFLEITAILVGAVVMVPLYFSALEFGFGR
jgi:hypothetical protein